MNNIHTIHDTFPLNTSTERYHPTMSLPVLMRDGSFQPADQLAARSYNSPYGRYMRDEQPLRFAQRFGYADRSTMLKELGTDLCPIGHQQELGWHVSHIIEKQRLHDHAFNLSDEEAAILLFACQIHDMGEMTHADVAAVTGAVVGDIPAGSKTDEDRVVEKNVRLFLYETFYSDVAPEIIERAESIIAHEDDTLLHELFEAAHEAQTLETVLMARNISEDLGWYEQHETLQLTDNTTGRAHVALGLGRLVLHNHLTKIQRYEQYSHIAELLAVVETGEQTAA